MSTALFPTATLRILEGKSHLTADPFWKYQELVVKLPKQPVIKAAIHSQAPTTNVVPSSLTVPSMITATGTGSVAGSSAGSSRNSTDIAENSEEAKDASALAQQMNSQDSQPQASPSESSSTTTVAIVAPIGSHVNPHQLMHRPPGHLTQPYLLEQLKDVQNHTSQALLRLEDYWKTGVVGSNQPPKDIKESTRPLKTLLELLQRHLRAGIEAMAQPNKEKLYPFRVCDPKVGSYPLKSVPQHILRYLQTSFSRFPTDFQSSVERGLCDRVLYPRLAVGVCSIRLAADRRIGFRK